MNEFRECFPDGIPINPWFYDNNVPTLESLGKQYVCTDVLVKNCYIEVNDDGVALKGKNDMPLSVAEHIIMRNCKCECGAYFNVKKEETQYHLSDFLFENLDIKADNPDFFEDAVENMIVKNVKVEKIV